MNNSIKPVGYVFEEGIIPARLYYHPPTFDDVFGVSLGKFGDVEAEEYTKRLIHRNNGMLTRDFDYVIAITWGNSDEFEKYRMVDFIGAKFTEDEWPGNPDMQFRTFRNEVLSSNTVLCGDGLRILGMEEDLRRSLDSLEQYIECLNADFSID